MTQQHALNVLCEGFPKNYNKDGDGSESFNNFSGTYKKYTKYIDYVPWPTPCEVAVEISRMANCEYLAAGTFAKGRGGEQPCPLSLLCAAKTDAFKMDFDAKLFTARS